MTDPVPPEQPPIDVVELRRRQAARSRVMGIGLLALAALFFAITIAKIGILAP